MTRDEALAKAREIWGKDGEAMRRQDKQRNRRFVVGRYVEHPDLGVYFEVRGAGSDFGEALADAEKYKNEPTTYMPRFAHLFEIAKAQALHDLRERQKSSRK